MVFLMNSRWVIWQPGPPSDQQGLAPCLGRGDCLRRGQSHVLGMDELHARIELDVEYDRIEAPQIWGVKAI